jgi:hypothetical protein
LTLSTRITLFHEKISRISRYTAGATARCRTTQLELFISYLYLSAAAAEPLRRAVTEQQAILSHVRIILLSPFQRRDQSQSHRVPFSQGLLRVASTSHIIPRISSIPSISLVCSTVTSNNHLVSRCLSRTSRSSSSGPAQRHPPIAFKRDLQLLSVFPRSLPVRQLAAPTNIAVFS